MVQDLAGVDAEVAARSLDLADNDIRLGIVVAMGIPVETAAQLLDAHRGSLRDVLHAIGKREA